MNDYEFSVIKYIPDMARFEPVNIGIAVIDKNKKQLHSKFINNFNELFLRLGIDKIHGLEESFEKYNPMISVESEEHLWKLHKEFHGSIVYSEPTKILSENIDNTIEQIFAKMISINKKERIVRARI